MRMKMSMIESSTRMDTRMEGTCIVLSVNEDETCESQLDVIVDPNWYTDVNMSECLDAWMIG